MNKQKSINNSKNTRDRVRCTMKRTWDILQKIEKENSGMEATRINESSMSLSGYIDSIGYVDLYVKSDKNGSIHYRLQDAPYEKKSRRSFTDQITDIMKGIDSLRNCSDGDCGNCDRCGASDSSDCSDDSIIDVYWFTLKFTRGPQDDRFFKESDLENVISHFTQFHNVRSMHQQKYVLVKG
jgi:hypothetical protein